MPTEKQNQSAQVDLNLKLSLEKTVKPEIRKLFGKMARDAGRAIAIGSRPDAIKFRKHWQVLLKDHYERVEKKAINRVFDAPKILDFLTPAVRRSILLFLEESQENQSLESADFITQTNIKEYNIAINQARQDIISNNAPLTKETLGRQTAVVLRRKFNTRINPIAVLETQKTFENTKWIVAREASRSQPLGSYRVWITIGDLKVRVEHNNANGQKQAIGNPFIIDGFQLMFPGDGSLGAPLRLIINCRCSIFYNLPNF